MYSSDFTQISTPLVNIWSNSITLLPNLFAALAIFVVGLMVATAVSALIQRLLEGLKFDSLLKHLGLEPYFTRAGLALRASWFIGQLTFWFLAVAFLIAAADILSLSAFSVFLQNVLWYIPNIVIAILMMLAAVVLANFVRGVVRASVKSARLPAAHFLGTLTWWVIVIFGFFAVLNQLDIASEIVNALVTGFIAMLALAGGLAFGLGGRDYAAHLINRLREHTESR